jgi:hypothetical protein
LMFAHKIICVMSPPCLLRTCTVAQPLTYNPGSQVVVDAMVTFAGTGSHRFCTIQNGYHRQQRASV